MMRGSSSQNHITVALTILWGTACGLCHAGDAFDVRQTPVDIATDVNANVELLKQLRLHDAALDNRTLEIEKRWTEVIVPVNELLKKRRRDPAAAGKPIATDKLPPAYDQPHRLVYQVTYRGGEHTIRIVEDREPRINKAFGIDTNHGFAWSNAAGELTDYSPLTGIGHKQTLYAGNLLDARVRSFHWCCGFGYAKWIQQIESIDVRDEMTVVFGQMRLMTDDETRCTIYLDRDWIARKAIISVPARQGGSNEYVVITEGTASSSNAPPLAKSGRYRRIVRPAGKKFNIQDDYTVVLVSLSRALSDEEYAAAMKLDIPPGATMVDMRSLLQP
jgi:hypothetical protein